MPNIFTGTGISDFLSGMQNNPAWQQAQTQLGNQQPLQDAAWKAYNQMMGSTPQQQVAGMSPERMAGINAQLAAAQGPIQQLMNTAQTGAQQFQQGIVPGQQALQNIAGGQGAQFSTDTAQQYGQALQPGLQGGQQFLGGLASGQQQPQFSTGVAQSYQNFIQPNLMGAQQALNDQANMAWNQNVGNIGGLGGGFMSSGRNNALAQAQQNASTQLGANQQQLAFNAAQSAAQAGQQAGQLGYQGQLSASKDLANQQFQGGALGAAAGQQTGLANLQAQLGAGQTLGQQGLAGTQLLPTLAQSQLLPGQIQESAGTILQQQRQNELNAQYQNQLLGYQNPFRALQNLQAGLGVLGSTTNAPNINVPNNTMSLMNLLGLSAPGVTQGLLGIGGNLLGSAFSGIGNMFSGGGGAGGYSDYEDWLYNTPAVGGNSGFEWTDDFGQYF